MTLQSSSRVRVSSLRQPFHRSFAIIISSSFGIAIESVLEVLLILPVLMGGSSDLAAEIIQLFHEHRGGCHRPAVRCMSIGIMSMLLPPNMLPLTRSAYLCAAPGIPNIVVPTMAYKVERPPDIACNPIYLP